MGIFVMIIKVSYADDSWFNRRYANILDDNQKVFNHLDATDVKKKVDHNRLLIEE